jgi:hypothetical protein
VQVDDSKLSADDVLTVNTLQGVTARARPVLYRLNGPDYDVFLGTLRDVWGVANDTRYIAGPLAQLAAAVAPAAGISQYVLCNLDDDSTMAALTMAGLASSEWSARARALASRCLAESQKLLLVVAEAYIACTPANQASTCQAGQFSQ